MASRGSITCPRCKTEVVLSAAKPFVEKNNGVSSTVQETRGKKPEKRRTITGEFEYPDFYQSWRRILFAFALLVAVGILVYVVYFLNNNTGQGELSAQVMGNLREQLEVLKEGVASYDKKKEGPDSIEVLNQIRDIKGRIDYLDIARRRLGSPSESDLAESVKLQQQIQEYLVRLNAIEEKFKEFVKSKTANLPTGSIQSIIEPAATPEKNKVLPTPPRSVDDVTILVNLPGITQTLVTDAMLQRLGALADNKSGKATAYASGDLLSISITPVGDPSNFATKVEFGRITWYSRKDRSMTIETDFDRLMGLNKVRPDDPVFELLTDLRDSDKPATQARAFEKLLKMEPTENQAAITVVLESLLNAKSPVVRERAVTGLAHWCGKDCVPLLVRMLEDSHPVVRWRTLDKLGQLKAGSASEAVAKTWKRKEGEKTTRALIAIGTEAEKAVLSYLTDDEDDVRLQACKVLAEIGTAAALPPLTELLNDRSKSVSTAAQDAMYQILERKKKSDQS